MIAVDTNVLVYAHRREARENGIAQALLRQLAEGHSLWAIPWPCVYEFISVVTNRRIWKDAASTPLVAWAQVDAWVSSPSVRLLSEVEGFHEVLRDFARRPRVTGPLIHDARIAALCAAHGVERLLSRDRDFSLFPELRIENPFEPKV